MAQRTVSRDLSRSRFPAQPRLLAAVAAAGLFAAGCGSNPAGQATKRPSDAQLAQADPGEKVLPPPATQPVAELPEVEVPKLDAAALLANRMKEYATRLSPAVEEHTQGKAAAPKSDVVWTDPGPATRPAKPVVEPTVVPHVKPVIDSTPSESNQTAALPGTGTANPAGATFRVTPAELNYTPPAAAPVVVGDPLEKKLAQQIKDFPTDIAAHLDHELLQFVHDKRDPTLAATVGLPGEDRELIRAIIDGLSNVREVVRADPNQLLSRKVQPMLDLADRLRSLADLNVPALALCTKVDGFGVYEPIEPARFVAGKEHMAIVYCEVENFASQLNDGRQWETKLSQETVLYREDGLAVWQDKTKSIVDHSRNRRHDFFIVKMVKLPSTLTIGRYVMKVSIRDLQADRVKESSVAVEIVAQ